MRFTYLKPDNNGGGEVQFPGCGNDSLSDDVTSHDATKDVDHDGIDLEKKKFLFFTSYGKFFLPLDHQ